MSIKATHLLGIFLSVSLAINLYLLTSTRIQPAMDWRIEYNYVIIEIKTWVDVNGTYGFETVAMVRMLPLNSKSEPEGYNWVHAPFKLDNRYGYKFIAPEEMYGKRFLFWQSEKTFTITPDRILTLTPGFSSDSWWMNYG